MNLKTVQANAIKSVFEVLKDLLNDVNFIFDEDGVRVTTLDTAHVTYVNMFLDASNFEVYDCKHRIVAGLNISNTFKILKIIGNNDTLTMSTDTNEIMDILIENSQKKSNTTFNLKLLDINEETYNANDLMFDVMTVMPSVNLQRIIRDMYNFSQIVYISRKGKYITLSCKGDFVDQKTEIECADDFEGSIEYSYSLKYINMFTKATNICSNVSIHQNQDGAIMFRYSIANLGDVDFYLAPNAEV